MKPAFSVILFTVASGAGLGMFVVIGLIDVAAAMNILHAPDASRMTFASFLAFALVIVGLGASALHLAKPSNAWRAFTRFRTSWLSREAVFAMIFAGVAVLYLVLRMTGTAGGARAVVAIAMVVLAWVVLLCTAMIYASLKPIRQWHTRWTPLVYFTLGHWSGAVLVVAVLAGRDTSLGEALWTTIAIGLMAIAVKWGYWRTIDEPGGSISLEQAIGVARGVRPPQQTGGSSIMRARLLDSGHSHGTYLTDEFGFVVARRHRTWLRVAFWVAGIAAPLVWVVAGAHGGAGVIAAVTCLLGMVAERWLFFAEARHTVRLYHGDAAMSANRSRRPGVLRRALENRPGV